MTPPSSSERTIWLIYFQSVSWCLLYVENSTIKAQTNRNMNRADSIKISGWKLPLIYFSRIYRIELWRSVMLWVSTKSAKLINSLSRMALNWNLFRGSRICTPHRTVSSKLIFQSICEFSISKLHEPKFPNLYHFKVWFWRESITMLPWLYDPVNTINFMMIFSYTLRTDNLLYIPTYPPVIYEI